MKVECPLCGRDKIRRFQAYGNPIIKGQYDIEIYPGICDCGMIYLSPRWSKEQYAKYYSETYDELYRLELKPDVGEVGVLKNAEEILHRLRRNLHPGRSLNILDVGSAYGNALKYYKDKIPGSCIYGIESAPEGRKILVDDLKGILVTDDFDDQQWAEDYARKFDLITMRHVFEHLLYPIEALEKIKRVLVEDGLIYISLPDTLHPRIKLRDYDDWWDYWFRVVHPFYYNRYTLGKLLLNNGLDIVDYSEENCELWVIAGLDRDNNKNSDFELDEKAVLERQIDVFDRYLAGCSLSEYI